MRKLIVANYKMNGDEKFYSLVTKKLNKLALKDARFVLCPPFVYLSKFKKHIKSGELGIQNISAFDFGAHTGEISHQMLKEFGVRYVIIGHSEVRSSGETDELIAKKVKIACGHDMIPIICVGEDKNSGLELIKSQVEKAIQYIDNSSKIIFAYEPIWAIGTKVTPTSEEIKTVVDNIKLTLEKLGFKDVPVLYGGSVNKDTYKHCLNSGCDGLLVGGASLNLDEFIEILKGVDNYE
ncbi:MAG: triose-phosphate isomerase [Clostridiales bacterium]|nr:triose-phosphate isomerase [Clostridiales bacterium]